MFDHGLSMRADQLQCGHRLKMFENSQMCPSLLGGHCGKPSPGGGVGAKCCGLAAGKRLAKVRLGLVGRL